MKEINVAWSEEDEQYLAKCIRYPSLSVLDDDADKAEREMVDLVKECDQWIKEEENETMDNE